MTTPPDRVHLVLASIQTKPQLLPVSAQQMDLINDQQAHFLDIGTVLPVAGDAIPLLGGANDDVS